MDKLLPQQANSNDGQILQTVGLAPNEASRSGFITGTYVVLTPIFTSTLLRERIPRSTWPAVLIATAGHASR